MFNNATLTQKEVLFLAFISFFLIGTHDALSKLVGLEVGFATAAILIQSWHSIFICGIKLFNTEATVFKPKKSLSTATYAALHAIGMVGFYFAATLMPLVELFIIILLRPIVTAILANWFLKEKISPLHILALIWGIISITITFQLMSPDHSFQFNILGIIGGLINVFSMSIRYIIVKTHTHPKDTTSLLFYSGIGTTIVALPFIEATNALNSYIIILTAVAGGVSLIGSLASLKANRSNYVSVLAASQFTILIWVGLYGWLIFNEIPSYHALIGMIFIVLSSITLYLDAKRKDKVNKRKAIVT